MNNITGTADGHEKPWIIKQQMFESCSRIYTIIICHMGASNFEARATAFAVCFMHGGRRNLGHLELYT